MAIAISYSPNNPKLHQTCTASVSGATASTVYYLLIGNPQGATQTLNFKTDGSGNASLPFVTVTAGTHTVNMYAMVNPSLFNNSFSTSGGAG